VAVDYRLVMVPVAITIVIFLDDYSIPIPMFVAITNDRAVVISITIAVMPSADCYANRPDTNPSLIRARRHGNTNARNCCHDQSVFHHVLLTLLS
jgi:hypothetical protein